MELAFTFPEGVPNVLHMKILCHVWQFLSHLNSVWSFACIIRLIGWSPVLQHLWKSLFTCSFTFLVKTHEVPLLSRFTVLAVFFIGVVSNPEKDKSLCDPFWLNRVFFFTFPFVSHFICKKELRLGELFHMIPLHSFITFYFLNVIAPSLLLKVPMGILHFILLRCTLCVNIVVS